MLAGAAVQKIDRYSAVFLRSPKVLHLIAASSHCGPYTPRDVLDRCSDAQMRAPKRSRDDERQPGAGPTEHTTIPLALWQEAAEEMEAPSRQPRAVATERFIFCVATSVASMSCSLEPEGHSKYLEFQCRCMNSVEQNSALSSESLTLSLACVLVAAGALFLDSCNDKFKSLRALQHAVSKLIVVTSLQLRKSFAVFPKWGLFSPTPVAKSKGHQRQDKNSQSFVSIISLIHCAAWNRQLDSHLVQEMQRLMSIALDATVACECVYLNSDYEPPAKQCHPGARLILHGTTPPIRSSDFIKDQPSSLEFTCVAWMSYIPLMFGAFCMCSSWVAFSSQLGHNRVKTKNKYAAKKSAAVLRHEQRAILQHLQQQARAHSANVETSSDLSDVQSLMSNVTTASHQSFASISSAFKHQLGGTAGSTQNMNLPVALFERCVVCIHRFLLAMSGVVHGETMQKAAARGWMTINMLFQILDLHIQRQKKGGQVFFSISDDVEFNDGLAYESLGRVASDVVFPMLQGDSGAREQAANDIRNLVHPQLLCLPVKFFYVLAPDIVEKNLKVVLTTCSHALCQDSSSLKQHECADASQLVRGVVDKMSSGDKFHSIFDTVASSILSELRGLESTGEPLLTLTFQPLLCDSEFMQAVQRAAECVIEPLILLKRVNRHVKELMLLMDRNHLVKHLEHPIKFSTCVLSSITPTSTSSFELLQAASKMDAHMAARAFAVMQCLSHLVTADSCTLTGLVKSLCYVCEVLIQIREITQRCVFDLGVTNLSRAVAVMEDAFWAVMTDPPESNGVLFGTASHQQLRTLVRTFKKTAIGSTLRSRLTCALDCLSAQRKALRSMVQGTVRVATWPSACSDQHEEMMQLHGSSAAKTAHRTVSDVGNEPSLQNSNASAVSCVFPSRASEWVDFLTSVASLSPSETLEAVSLSVAAAVDLKGTRHDFCKLEDDENHALLNKLSKECVIIIERAAFASPSAANVFDSMMRAILTCHQGPASGGPNNSVFEAFAQRVSKLLTRGNLKAAATLIQLLNCHDEYTACLRTSPLNKKLTSSSQSQTAQLQNGMWESLVVHSLHLLHKQRLSGDDVNVMRTIWAMSPSKQLQNKCNKTCAPSLNAVQSSWAMDLPVKLAHALYMCLCCGLASFETFAVHIAHEMKSKQIGYFNSCISIIEYSHIASLAESNSNVGAMKCIKSIVNNTIVEKNPRIAIDKRLFEIVQSLCKMGMMPRFMLSIVQISDALEGTDVALLHQLWAQHAHYILLSSTRTVLEFGHPTFSSQQSFMPIVCVAYRALQAHSGSLSFDTAAQLLSVLQSIDFRANKDTLLVCWLINTLAANFARALPMKGEVCEMHSAFYYYCSLLQRALAENTVHREAIVLSVGSVSESSLLAGVVSVSLLSTVKRQDSWALESSEFGELWSRFKILLTPALPRAKQALQATPSSSCSARRRTWVKLSTDSLVHASGRRQTLLRRCVAGLVDDENCAVLQA